MSELGALLAGYLLGAIPFAYVIARVRTGVDIRSVDIGNVGAGSVFRAVGFKEGLLTLAGDVCKGYVAIVLAQLLGVGLYWVLAAGILAVVGHVYPVYIGFRGGQGVATAIGVFLALTPIAMLLTMAVMGIALLFNIRRGLSRRLFLVVACAAPFLPAFVYWQERSVVLTLYAIALLTFIALRNLERLRHPRTITSRLLGELEAPGLQDIHKE
jgi:acyl phosphate:glycerol-3-phosphate acyltransferase